MCKYMKKDVVPLCQFVAKSRASIFSPQHVDRILLRDKLAT